MSRTWTASQTAAITERNKSLLISAAAGSGKTSTLTERIIRSITDKNLPSDISKMLIVTFTRTAAAELRAKIFSALTEALAEDPADKNIASQLMKMSSAKICTIDSFYYDLIKSNFSLLGISSNIRIADEAEYAVIAHNAMDKVIDKFYDTDADFPSFTECFAGVRQTNNLPNIFLDIYGKLTSVPEGIEFLRVVSERTESEKDIDFFKTSYGMILKESMIDLFRHYENTLTRAVDFISNDENADAAYGKSFILDLNFCKQIINVLSADNNCYAEAQNLIFSYSPLKLSRLSSEFSSDALESYKEMRKEFCARIKKLKETSFSKSQETISTAMLDTARNTLILYKLLCEFEKIANEEKSRLGIMTFTDIRRYTLSLLVKPDGTPTDIAKEYAEQFTDIYIDEYQDVDAVQDLIFKSISKPTNRFMVGDIKQSIYEFRGAQPKLFASYRSEFPMYNSPKAKSSDSVAVFMSENFRCDENIIKFTNLVCSKIFSAAKESIGYTSDDDLKFAKKYSDPDYISPKVKVVHIVTPPKNDIPEDYGFCSPKEAEAEYIASEIDDLLKHGKKADGSRIIPSDIAILFRTKTICPIVSEALRKRGIAFTDADSTGYFESPDVLLLLSVLNAVDNPERDTYLAGALHSPIFNFNMDELIRIRSAYDNSHSLYSALCSYSVDLTDELSEKCRSFKRTLELWQDRSRAMPIDGFLRMLFDTEQFVSSGLVSQGTGEGGNLMLLYEYARGFESGGFKGLYQFIEYLNSILDSGKKLALSNSEKEEGKVSLMTMHKSKGLEFPVCFVCDTLHSIRSKDIRSSLVFEYPSGVAMKIADSTGFARINTPMRDAIYTKIATKQAEEEMRILYVALTRARERLYVTSASSKTEEALLSEAAYNAEVFDRNTVLESSSYLDWIMVACTEADDNSSFEFDFIPAQMISKNDAEPLQHIAEDTKDVQADTALTERLINKFSFEYPYKKLSSVPSKFSVSRLYPDVLDENDTSFELFCEQKRSKIPSFFSNGTTETDNSAKRGTATHLFLQFCNFENMCKNGIEGELDRLEYKKFIPTETRQLLYKEELERFTHSELIGEILSSKEIIREQRFNINLPPHSFTNDPDLVKLLQGEELAVQGVIDLIVIRKDGSIALYDYKTDRLTKNEMSVHALAQKKLAERHGTQLAYYAKAVELMFERPCDRVAVYSTHSALLYDIDISQVL